MLVIYIQISRIKTFLIDSQPEECSQYVLKILVNLSLKVLIKKVLELKKAVLYFFSPVNSFIPIRILFFWSRQKSIDLDSVWVGDSRPFIFFLSRVFASHSRFRCGDPSQYLPNFLNMLLLALPQIYARVFYFCKSINLDSVWVGDSRPYKLSFLS